MSLEKANTGPGIRLPKPSSPTPGIGPNTRKTTRRPALMADIEAMANTVMDTRSAENYLTAKLLCLIGEPFDFIHLSSILFHITQMSGTIPLPVITAIRAVAFLLKKNTACEIAEAAATWLSAMLTSQVVEQVIAAIKPQMEGLLAISQDIRDLNHQISESLASALTNAEHMHRLLKNEQDERKDDMKIAADRIDETTNEIHTSVAECQSMLKSLTPSLDTMQECLNQLSTQLSNQPPSVLTSSPILNQPSYSTVAASHLPPSVDQAVGQAAIQAQQILLDPQPGEHLFPHNTSNTDIAKKLREALSNIHSDDSPPGDVKSSACPP
ncbi:hypothetical protein BDR06DRAFT_1001429 [Suillus hirtellus]|nr:hypothetical protein BDR06DRAFT_1001429 [Suillus hirtellus]